LPRRRRWRVRLCNGRRRRGVVRRRRGIVRRKKGIVVLVERLVVEEL
jgi:hypothetical protein